MKKSTGYTAAKAALLGGLVFAAAGSVVPACAQAQAQAHAAPKPASQKWVDYKGVPPAQYDYSKAPKCGVKGLSREEKLERNVRVAEYYYQNYRDAEKRDTILRKQVPDCFADGTSIIMGIFKYMAKMPEFDGIYIKPALTAAQKEAERKALAEGRAGEQLEIKMWKSKYPDFAAVEGSFRVIAAWEDGVEFILDFKGTNADGYTMNYWEHNTFLFNDDGLIWRWDEVADTLGVDMGLRKGWGKGMSEFPYLEVLQSMDKKPKGK